MSARTDLTHRFRTNLERAARAVNPPELPWGWLARITNATLIAGTNARYLYAWEEATFSGTAPYTPSVKAGGMTGNAISVSELGNSAPPTFYAYGVPSGDLPGTFGPKAIPVGTPVWIAPYRASDGAEIYVIVNTQAISGACP